jgi:hypothetical protein
MPLKWSTNFFVVERSWQKLTAGVLVLPFLCRDGEGNCSKAHRCTESILAQSRSGPRLPVPLRYLDQAYPGHTSLLSHVVGGGARATEVEVEEVEVELRKFKSESDPPTQAVRALGPVQ